MNETADLEGIARRLGMKPREVLAAEDVDGVGLVVTTHDQTRWVLTDDGVEPYAAPAAAPVEDIEDVELPAQDSDEVMPARVDDILAWVGRDPEPPTRASLALDAEQSASKPRPSLVDALKKLVSPS